jgi:hypothetical protein
MRCAELFNRPPQLPEIAADAIYNFMLPILPNVKSIEAETDKLIKKLCDDAYALTILMRKCKDTYVVELPAQNTLMSEFEGAEPQDTERGGPTTSSESPMIAFCLFGALIKRPEHSPAERMVLEPAHVVQYK